MSKLVRFMKDESGATAIEYGLIAAATGLVLVLLCRQLRARWMRRSRRFRLLCNHSSPNRRVA